MIAEVLEDQLSVNAALPRTLVALLFRPGYLSREYLAGRIQRYIPPFRLYLATSVIFFLLLTFMMRDVGVNGENLAAARDSIAADSGGNRGQLRIGVGRMNEGQARAARPARDSVPRGSAAADTSAGPYLWGDQIEIHTEWALLDTVIAHRLDRLRRMPVEEAVRQFTGQALNHAPTAIFLLLPIFAALLKLLYIRSKRYYVEHFVFGLHTHAFMFIMFTVMLIGDYTWVQLPIMTWMLLYFFLAMKRFYQQGFIKTALKYGVLFNLYMVIFSIGVGGLLVVALLLA